MTPKRLACVVLLAAALAVCVSEHDQIVINDLFEHPLNYDGKVVEIVIYPADSGRQDEYRFCWEVCWKEEAREAHYLSGYWPCCYIHSRVPGEYTGWNGSKPVRVRARFDALCYRPNAMCPDMISDVFYEVEVIK